MCDRSWSDSSIGGGVLKVPPHIRDALERAAQSQEAVVASTEPDDFFEEAEETDVLSGVLSGSGVVSPRKRPREPDGGTPDDAVDDKLVASLRADLERAYEKCGATERRESSLALRLSQKEREAQDLRGYCHDVLRLHEQEHAYLRATHLDPAIGLEIEVLKSKLALAVKARQELKSVADLAEDDELKIATRKCEALEEEKKSLAIVAANAETERDELRTRLSEVEGKLSEAKEWNDQLEEEREELYVMIDEAKRQADTRQGAEEDAPSREEEEEAADVEASGTDGVDEPPPP